MYIDIHIQHIHVHMYIDIHIQHIHVHMYIDIHVQYIHVHVHTYTCTCTCTHVHTYIHNIHRDLKTDYTNTHLSMSQCKFFIIIIFFISTPRHFNRHITISLLSSIRPQSSTAFLLPLLY